MKLMCIILSVTILFAGCYTNTTVTKDTPSLDNEEITVTLADESMIISQSGQHHRVEDGYKIVGELRTKPTDHWSERYQRSDSLFDGIVYDGQIKDITCREFDVITTVLVVGVSLLFTIVVVGGGVSHTVGKW
jgi:hypothetical protein